jgi:hypothetical protein
MDTIMALSFQTNGSTSGAVPAASILAPRGIASVTVSQSGTTAGLYTVTLPYGSTFPKQPWAIVAQSQSATLATDWFQVMVLGPVTYSAGKMSFQVQCHRSGTANAPANTAGNRVNILLLAGNTSGG